MKLEKAFYYFWGNNAVIGSHIRRQIDFLSQVVPDTFKHRRMDDLGCGDGKVTLLLKDVFRPTVLRGFDVNAGLVRRARSRGCAAEVKNLDDGMPSGELAVLWGVLHHLKDCGYSLKTVRENYSLIFIREPLKNGHLQGMELGHSLRKAEMEELVREHLPGAQVHYCGSNIMVFYSR